MQNVRGAVVVGMVLVSSGAMDARAHGQFPLPLTTLPGDPLLGVVTFGVLVARSDIPAYEWICEEMVGGNVSTAVAWTRSSEGTLVAGARGVLRFSENACGASRPLGDLDTRAVRSGTCQ